VALGAKRLLRLLKTRYSRLKAFRQFDRRLAVDALQFAAWDMLAPT
jgi:hypothetical protein